MFCLRSWIPILFFLSVIPNNLLIATLIPRRTNASPIYLILFITATYVLNRPCVYCSLLLAILVLSLFDFNSSWFEPRYSHPSTLFATSNTSTSSLSTPTLLPMPTVLADAMDVLTAVVNGTVASVVGALREKGMDASSGSALGEWMKGVMRKEWRISCFDVAIRL